MKTAIVILNWNGKQHLEKYIPHVIEFTNLEQNELYVADNGSTDNSLAFLRANYPQVKLIELDKNYGFAGGYNLALANIEADIFCILNSDVRVSKKWLNSPLKTFAKHSEVAAIQPKILSDRDSSRFEHAGAAGGFIDKYGYPFCRGRIMNAIEYDTGQYNSQSDILWASGACLFIRADMFKENGGFDADYFAHMEEIDLCWRLKNRGYRIVYCPKSKVYHYGGATLEYNNPQKLYLNFRNSLWTLYKNHSGKNLRLTMLSRMLIDTTAIAKYLVSFEFKNANAIIKAHLAYYASKKELKKKREQLLKNVTHKYHPEILMGSIVFHFFIKSQKTFNELKKFRSITILNAKQN
ncbi:MAG TPA: glycosyltransferase family 2 protein [Prolixibacteraceae bacterium]|nr:glycosyltransferase family 2 protein [Prolixibacteraceae bacterium]